MNLHHGILESWKLDRESRTSVLPARHFQISFPICKMKSLFLLLKQPLILHLSFLIYYSRSFAFVMYFNSHSTLQRNNTFSFHMRKVRLKLNDLPKVTEKVLGPGFCTGSDSLKAHALFPIGRYFS